MSCIWSWSLIAWEKLRWYRNHVIEVRVSPCDESGSKGVHTNLQINVFFFSFPAQHSPTFHLPCWWMHGHPLPPMTATPHTAQVLPAHSASPIHAWHPAPTLTLPTSADHWTSPPQPRALPACQHQAPKRHAPLQPTWDRQDAAYMHGHCDAQDQLPQGGLLCHLDKYYTLASQHAWCTRCSAMHTTMSPVSSLWMRLMPLVGAGSPRAPVQTVRSSAH